MAKQDPFMKDEGKGDGVMKEDFMDFNDPGKGSGKGSGRNIKVIAAVLVVLGLAAGVGMYLMNQEDSNVVEDVKPAAMPKKPKNMEAIKKLETNDQSVTLAMPMTTPKADMPKAEMAPPTVMTQTNVVKPNPANPEKMPTAQNKDVVLPKNTMSEPKVEKEELASIPHGIPSLLLPENEAVRDYDETSSMPVFTWSGGGKSWVAFSRNAQMSPIEMKGWTQANHYDFPRPAPGVWYWQVGNDLGKSEVRMFTVNPPVKRSIAVIAPAAGGTVANEGMISWKGDHMVTYYRIELSNKGWANPNYRFATTGTQLRLHSVEQGAYEMRVGAFSEIAGRWEYTAPVKITVQ